LATNWASCRAGKRPVVKARGVGGRRDAALYGRPEARRYRRKSADLQRRGRTTTKGVSRRVPADHDPWGGEG